jgi:hypothetical protein
LLTTTTKKTKTVSLQTEIVNGEIDQKIQEKKKTLADPHQKVQNVKVNLEIVCTILRDQILHVLVENRHVLNSVTNQYAFQLLVKSASFEIFKLENKDNKFHSWKSSV